MAGRLNAILLGTALILGTAPAGVSAASASDAGPHCGQVVTTNITLTRDLGDCPGNGLVVGSDSITINLNGHRIYSSAPADGGGHDGVNVDTHHDIRIENGEIAGFGRGILLSDASRVTVRQVTIANSSVLGVVIAGGGYNTVDHSTIRNTGAGADDHWGYVAVSTTSNVMSHSVLAHNGNAVLLLDDANSGRYADNFLLDNRNVGFEANFNRGNSMLGNRVVGGSITLESADNTLIADNVLPTVSECDGCGIGIQIYGNNNVVRHNNVAGGSRYGIEVDDFMDPGHSPVVENIIRDNFVTGAGIGIALGPEASGVVLRTLIASNVVSHSTGDGIQLLGPSTGLGTSRVKDNIAVANGGFGIDAISRTVDRGGNRAALNGTRPQCHKVDCDPLR